MNRVRRLLLIGLLAVPQASWAKKVTVDWKPIKGAVSYEIQIMKEGKVIKVRKAKESTWTGDVPFGLYTYQIRAIDRVDRPGKWTKVHALIAMPKEAENFSPRDGEELKTYTRSAKTKFSWTSAEGSAAKKSKYRLVVKNADDGKVAVDEVVEGSETDVKKLPPGKYTWQVTLIIEARGLAALEGKKWESKPSSPSGFEVTKLQLDAPELIFPRGSMRPQPNKKIQFRWSRVDGAEAYEVKLTPASQEKNGTLSEKKWITKLTSSTLPLAAEGAYTWQVRALASVDSNQVAEEASAQSSASFELDRNAGFWNGNGDLSFSSMYAPYQYTVASPDQHLKSTSTSSAAVAIGLAGDYWIRPQFGLGLNFQDSFFAINGQNYDYKDIELDAKYRINLTPGVYGWSMIAHAGILSRDYVLLTPSYSFDGSVTSINGINDEQFGTHGPAAGFEIRKQLSDRFSAAATASYYYPVGSDIVRGSDSNRNLSLGVSALDWVSKSWGVSLGVLHENRSISHINNGEADPDTVSMDGTYIFGSLIYCFGRQ